VVLEADPRADVANLARIALVVKDGRAYRQSELVSATPADIVQRQLNAYNARDLDSFIATYRPDVRIYGFPDKLELQGHGAMRREYEKLFSENPALHARVPRRIIAGNHVIDEEIVTGLPGGRTIRATAIYEVIDGLISRVWFIGGDAQQDAKGAAAPRE
jgi:hypothetical protein